VADINLVVTALGRSAVADGLRLVELRSDGATVALGVPPDLALNLAMRLLPSADEDETTVAWQATRVSLAADATGTLLLMLDLGGRRLPVRLPMDAPETLHAALSAFLTEGRPARPH